MNEWVKFWRTLAIGSAVALLGLLGWLAFGSGDRNAPYLAVMSDGQGRAVMLALLQPPGGRLAVRVLVPQQVPDGRTLYLWALKADGRPVAVGAIENEGKTVFLRGAALTLQPDTEPDVAISIEPKGAPFGEPTSALRLRATWTRM